MGSVQGVKRPSWATLLLSSWSRSNVLDAMDGAGITELDHNLLARLGVGPSSLDIPYLPTTKELTRPLHCLRGISCFQIH